MATLWPQEGPPVSPSAVWVFPETPPVVPSTTTPAAPTAAELQAQINALTVQLNNLKFNQQRANTGG